MNLDTKAEHANSGIFTIMYICAAHTRTEDKILAFQQGIQRVSL